MKTQQESLEDAARTKSVLDAFAGKEVEGERGDKGKLVKKESIVVKDNRADTVMNTEEEENEAEGKKGDGT